MNTSKYGGELLYQGEHLSCSNYCHNGRSPVEVLRLEPGASIKRELGDTEIVLVTSGSILLSYKLLSKYVVDGPGIMLFPAGARVTADALGECEVLVYSFRRDIRLCESYSLEELERFRENGGENGGFRVLGLNGTLHSYAQLLIANIENGLRCRFYLQGMTSELLILMKAYYTKQDLADFFSPVLGKDMAFKNFVLRNYAHINSVNEFAEKANYSRNGFTKQFKRVLGKPPYQWLREEKSKLILHELRCTDKAIKEISEEYGFSSVSRFNEFCNELLGSPPGKIRKEAAVREYS